MSKDKAQELFVRWVKTRHPAVYQRAVATLQKRGLGSLQGWEAIVNAVVQAGSVVMQKKQAAQAAKIQAKTLAAQQEQADKDRAAAIQAQLLAVNAQRAQDGLPPVDEFGRPIAGASLVAAPEVNAFANVGAAVSKIGPYLLIAGVGLVALVFWRNR